jgi:DNA-binding FadR family transcriptional regulator
MNTARNTDATSVVRSGSADIAQSLINDIKEGVLEIDAPLPTERDLCERFGASRPTVRAALSQMQMQGYVTAQAGHRPRAAKPSLDGILRGASELILDLMGDAEAGAHLEQMRQFIEMGAAREAAARADTVQLANLQDALAKNAATIGTPQFAETDIAFHRALVAVVGNPVLLTLHDMFVSRLIAQRPQTDDQAGYDRMAFEEHRAIHTAVLDRDVATATEVMERHLSRSFRNRLRAVTLSGTDGHG